MNWYLTALKKYAVFSGRARRKEYWMYSLVSFLFLLVAMFIDNMTGLNFTGLPYGYLYLIYSLATLIPALAVSVRRLHDTNRSGWWFLILFIPIVGAIWILVLFCQDSTPGENKYGPNPKNQEAFNNEALDGHLAR